MLSKRPIESSPFHAEPARNILTVTASLRARL